MNELDRYYAKALKFLSYRPRSEKEVRENLVKKKAPSHIIQTIIDKLREHRFLDDAEFSRIWVESRIRSKPQSLRITKLELRRKGVSEEIIESQISNIKFPIPNDIEQARKLVEKKMARYKGLSRDEIYKKLSGVLGRRGFNWDTIKEAIDEVMAKEV